MKTTLIFAVLVTLGCSPTFQAVTPPPPGAIASLHRGDDEVEISPGAALAFSCRRRWSGAACTRATAVSDDPSIAVVSPAHLHRLDFGGRRGIQPASTFVVAGVSPGVTTIRIETKDRSGEIQVTVLGTGPRTGNGRVSSKVGNR